MGNRLASAVALVGERSECASALQGLAQALERSSLGYCHDGEGLAQSGTGNFTEKSRLPRRINKDRTRTGADTLCD